MGGGAADQGQIGADLRLEPAVLEHRRESPPPRLGHGFRETASLPIPDELLAEIFLRLPTPADLVRASAACVSFRRIAASRSFVRRFRKLHAPPLLGFLGVGDHDHERKVFHPAAPPHPSALAASAAALAADFSFSFLPAPAIDWRVLDIQDGRVLLDRIPQHDRDARHKVVFPELVVCDPLHRRYLMLPPIPAHLTAMVERPLPLSSETFLAPAVASDNGESLAAEETSFSMVWMAQCSTKLVAFVFSSSTGQWRSISSQSWIDLLPSSLKSGPWSTGWPLFSCRHYVYGCFYWVTEWREKLLVLDIRRMEFSIAEPPPEAIGLHGVDIAFVEAGEGRLGMFFRPGYTTDLNLINYSIRQNNCGSFSHWQFQRTISLDFEYLIAGATGRHLFMCPWGPSLHAGCFSLDVKTLQLERVCLSDSSMPYGHAYSNFPPLLLSTPTISSGIEGVTGNELLEQSCAASPSAQSP